VVLREALDREDGARPVGEEFEKPACGILQRRMRLTSEATLEDALVAAAVL